MFTGAPPRVHGITVYQKPVLTCDTLFDALIRAGKRPAIVAVANSSIDLIFRDRQMDYFSERYDPEVTQRTVELLRAGEHDFILSYHQEYDDALHATSPKSESSMRAAGNHVSAFAALAETARSAWAEHDHAVVFAPDHGAHVDIETGAGTHGQDIPEDMHVRHCYGFAERSPGPG
jgi:hypothetical protein